MDLYIIRHAWAGHYGDPQWPDDGQRPLTDEGRARFSRVVARLARRGFAPQSIATSPLVRCLQTARIVAEGLPGDTEVVELDELMPGSDLEGLLRWSGKQAAAYGQIAWVGHAPDVGRLTADLIGETDGWIRFAKGAVAAVRFEDLPQLGQGELRWLVTAKLLGC
ncbi:MAG: SixA phosphatase family protein [Planctomycetota bacterium]|jgi:phosphohistidine phosphatase